MTRASFFDSPSYRKGGIGAVIALLLVGIVYFISDRGSLPGCDDQKTKDLVLQIVDEKIGIWIKSVHGSYELGAIRQKSKDFQTGAYTCAAQLQLGIVTYNGPKQVDVDITYTIEKTLKPDEFYVTVYGL